MKSTATVAIPIDAMEQLATFLELAAPAIRAFVAQRLEQMEEESTELEAVQVAAKKLGVSESFVYRLLKTRRLRGERRGRAWLVDVKSREAYRRQQRAEGRPAGALAIVARR